MDFAHAVKLNVFSSGACVPYIYCSLMEKINTYKKLHSSHHYGAHGEPTVFASVTGCVTTGKNLTARTSSMVRENRDPSVTARGLVH